MKSLAKNSFYNIIYRCLNVIFPLIISAYVSRILMAEGIGKVASAQNIVTYFALIAALGLPTYGVKKIAETNDRDQLSKYFSELFVINLISSIICSVLYYSMILSVDFFADKRSLFLIVGIQIVFNIINVDWFYQGREEYRYIMIRSFLIKLASLLAVFVFVKSSDDFIIYALIQTLVKVANYLFNIVHIRKYIDFTIHNITLKSHLKPLFILLAASIAIEIYTLADTTMLSAMCTDTIVGYYSNARKGIDVVRTLVTAICAVFLPRLSFYYANNKYNDFNILANRGLKILTFLSIPAAVGLLLLADDFVAVMFGNSFEPAAITIKILTISIITVAFSNFIGYQILVTIGKEKMMLISTIFGAVTNICLNYILIPLFYHNGAAFASVITELVVTLIQFSAVRGAIKIEIDKKFIVSTVFSIIVMTVIVIGLKNAVESQFIELFLACIIGVAAYLTMSLITKNQIAETLKSKVFRK